MTSISYIGAPVTQPPYPFLHRTPPGKKRKSGPKYPENIGPQAKIFPQNIRSHIGHVPRLSGVLLHLSFRVDGTRAAISSDHADARHEDTWELCGHYGGPTTARHLCHSPRLVSLPR